VDAEVGGLGAPDYNRLIEEQNDLAAQKAAADGQSFMPTPVGQDQLITPKPIETPSPPPETKPKPLEFQLAPKPQAPPLKTPAALDNSLAKKEPQPEILESQKALLADLKNFLGQNAGRWSGAVLAYSPAPKSAAPPPKEIKVENESLKPGDLLLATTLMALNSDVPSPVVATVSYGPHKGAKFLGRFERGSQGAVLSFNRLMPVDGPPRTVEALAVDPRTAQPQVASSVDTHFLKRWGGLLASGFLEGFGSALGDRGSRVYANGDYLIEQRPEKSLADASWEALGQVGRYAGEQFRKDFDQPPTIKVNPGYQLAILILGIDK
jgi:hypothetical protein